MTDTAQKIAAALGETEKSPLHTIERIVKMLGKERALALLDETLKIEPEGDGMLTDDGSRRRSPGGVYFKLAKSQTTSRERWLIFSNKRPAKPKEAKPKVSPVTWEEIEEVSGAILDSPAEAKTMKLTLIDNLGDVILSAWNNGRTEPLHPSPGLSVSTKWYIAGENTWYIVGENTWYIVGENCWYIIGRKLTCPTIAISSGGAYHTFSSDNRCNRLPSRHRWALALRERDTLPKSNPKYWKLPVLCPGDSLSSDALRRS